MRNELRLLVSSLPSTISGTITILWAALILAGCATQTSSLIKSDTNLKAAKNFYVVQSGSDTHETYKVIEAELAKLGRQASSGPRAGAPSNIDLIVTYQDYWVWDMLWYLHNLLIQFRDPKTNVLLASSLSYRPSLERRDPEFMA